MNQNYRNYDDSDDEDRINAYEQASDQVTYLSSDLGVYLREQENEIETNLQEILFDNVDNLSVDDEFLLESSNGDIYGKINKKNQTNFYQIDTQNKLDKFTFKYGLINNEQYTIDWPKVMKKYKGIFISSSSIQNREDYMPNKVTKYNNTSTKKNTHSNTIKSWISQNIIDKPIKFITKEEDYSKIIPIEITEPFKAIMTDKYLLNENEMTYKVTNKDKNNILIIDSLSIFDKFTNNFGKIINGEFYIKWDEVKKNFKGFFIEPLETIQLTRTENIWYKHKQYNSWLKNIDNDVVYLFK